MSAYSTWERPMAPVSPTVSAVARMWLHTTLPEDMPAPVGLLVGEQPGTAHNAKLPLWPWPANSAGDRLMRMSGIPVADYLTRLARVNLALKPVAEWDSRAARDRALSLVATLPVGTRVVACGAKARDAFGLPDWFHLQAMGAHPEAPAVVAIPHPSGRSRAYNDPGVKGAARWWIRWAARV